MKRRDQEMLQGTHFSPLLASSWKGLLPCWCSASCDGPTREGHQMTPRTFYISCPWMWPFPPASRSLGKFLGPGEWAWPGSFPTWSLPWLLRRGHSCWPRPVSSELTLLTPSSSEWRSVGPAEQKRLCHMALDDGEFWYSAHLIFLSVLTT